MTRSRGALPAALLAVLPWALCVLAPVLLAGPASAAPAAPAAPPDLASIQATVDKLSAAVTDLDHRFDEIAKGIDDNLWFERVSDVAIVDKVFIAGPPPWKIPNPTAMGAANPVKFWCYVFIPRALPKGGKCPLIVLPHGGVHADFTTYHTHIVREMVAQGYVVLAPEYRGSTGYGKGFYQRIDYGGREVEDCDAARAWAIDNYPFVDGSRAAMVGWSHGGLIALMAVFEHPDSYKCAFAGVPVSDLVQRMGYWGQEYESDFSAPYFLGQSVGQNIAEYKKRSPVWNVEKLKTPLLIHSNTNDDDVNVIEVEHLVQALKAAGKEKLFEYEIYQDIPGGHSFDRIDTAKAQEIRVKIYGWLAKHLDPPSPLRSVDELRRAAYRQP